LWIILWSHQKIVGNIGKVGDKISSATGDIDNLGKSILELRNDLTQFEQLHDNAFTTQEIRKYNENIEKTQKELKKTWKFTSQKSQEELGVVICLQNCIFDISDTTGITMKLILRLKSFI